MQKPKQCPWTHDECTILLAQRLLLIGRGQEQFYVPRIRTLLWNPDGTPTARTGKIINNTPMGRFGTADELIGTLLWLVDNKLSGFVTGTVIPVDGGFSAYSGV